MWSINACLQHFKNILWVYGKPVEYFGERLTNYTIYVDSYRDEGQRHRINSWLF